MKAFLLAAGIGSRLRPLTDRLPKCLVPIADRPILYYWLTLFERYRIDEVTINLHHFPELVRDYVHKHPFNLKVNLFYEKELLGSAGTIKACAKFIENEDNFLICYADNLTNINLENFIHFHQSHKPLLTLGLFQTDRPQHCGIVELAEDGTIISFEEKPKNPRSDLAGAGMYVTSPAIIDYIPDKIPADIGFDLLPQLVGKMKGYLIDDYFIDIGTFENYRLAEKEWQHIVT